MQSMTEGGGAAGVILGEIIIMHFILPGVLTYLFAEIMYKKGWIKPGDMKLSD
jgi:uncharacterized membrane protein